VIAQGLAHYFDVHDDGPHDLLHFAKKQR